MEGSVTLPGAEPFTNGRLVVRAEDVTYQDSKAKVLGEWVLEGAASKDAPFRFRIALADWNEGMDAAISASLDADGDGHPDFWNPVSVPVTGMGSYDLVLQKVDRKGG